MPGSENSTAIMFYYVYVIESLKAEGRLYVGSTPKLKERFEKHNRAVNFSTKSYVPWKLIFYEAYLTKSDALRREKYLKTSQGARLLKRMLKDYLYLNKQNN
jgi:putative endonuclease